MIERVHEENYGVYGIRKVHAELQRLGHRVARCTVARLMRAAGLRGISRAKGPRTTIPGSGPTAGPIWSSGRSPPPHPTSCGSLTSSLLPHLLRLGLRRLRRRCVLPPRRRLATVQSLKTDLALDALEMGLWTRRREGRTTSGLVHHSDKGVQYVAVRYTQRLADAGAAASVGSTGDSYDNALAEAFNSLFKAELVRNKGPWCSIDDLEIAVAEYLDWYNHRRLHGEIGLLPPVEFEGDHYRANPVPTTVGASLQSLH